MNLGVYICAYNEDRFILPCINAIKKVFPQVIVLDFGSSDNTLDYIKSSNVEYKTFILKNPIDYTLHRNSLLKNYDWIFWVDADEIYPEESLKLLKFKIETNEKYKGIRISWQFLKEENGFLFLANDMVVSTSKAFDASFYEFRRSWPNDVIHPIDPLIKRRTAAKVKGPKVFNGIYCYHCSLLIRSSKLEQKRRIIKRLNNIESYNKIVKSWKCINKFPWEDVDADS